MKKIIIIMLGLLSFQAFGQIASLPEELWIYNNVFPTSVDAAALVKSVNYPIGEFTGTTDISIPLHLIEGRNISVPMSLEYHQSGVKVAEESSWVGMGWTLEAGGVITRIVQGLPDDSEEGYLNNSIAHYPINIKELSDPNHDINSELSSIAEGIKDGLPDVFQFSFNGYKGSFTIDKNDISAVMMPYQDIDIHINVINDEIDNFEVITQDGTKYLFKDKEYSEGTYIMEEQFADQSNKSIEIEKHAISWYLSEIIAPNNLSSNDALSESVIYLNDRIKFTYTEENDNEYYSQELNMSEYEHSSSGNSLFDSVIEPPVSIDPSVPNPFTTTVCVGNIFGPTYIKTRYERKVWPRYLKKIESESNSTKVDFIYGGALGDLGGLDRTDLKNEDNSWKAKRLAKINIKLGGSSKSFKLNHEFLGNTDDPNCNRMFLKSIKETAGSIDFKPYDFSYNDTFNLPCKDSYNFDHWGYYNSSGNSSTSLISKDAVRTSSLSGSKLGLLKKIVNPLGGEVEYQYELHDFDVIDGQEDIYQVGGGVRLKSITSRDNLGNSDDIVKSFTYTDEEGTSSGNLYVPYKYDYMLTQAYLTPVIQSPYIEGRVCDINIEISNNNMHNTVISGNEVGYGQVETYNINNNGNSVNGKIVNSYKLNPWNRIKEEIPYSSLTGINTTLDNFVNNFKYPFVPMTNMAGSLRGALRESKVYWFSPL